MLYPFWFNVYARNPDTGDLSGYLFTKVIVAHASMTHYNAMWMNDPDFGRQVTLVPDVDVAAEQHKFNSEAEALAFIKDWWSRQ